MTDAELRRALRRIHPPDELGAERRAWMLVRAAFDEREPATRRPQVIRPLLVLAGALALIAAVVNPPVLNAIRDAVGRTTEKKVVTYKQALFSLPAQGRLLVNTARGPWIIKPGGARRLLGRYRDASWSPRGLFVAAVGRHELVALQPNGTVRWSLARSGRLSSPRWSPENEGSTWIAYLRGTTLRIVAGDSTEDTLLDGAVATTAPAWKPGTSFVLSYVTAAGRIRVYDVGTQKTLWHSLRLPKVTELAWSDDGTRLLALTRRSLIVFGGRGQRIGRAYFPADAVAAAFEPGSHRIAALLRFPQQSAVQLRDGDAPAAAARHRVQRRRPVRHARVVAERPLAPRRLAERRRVHVRDARRAAANRGRHRRASSARSRRCPRRAGAAPPRHSGRRRRPGRLERVRGRALAPVALDRSSVCGTAPAWCPASGARGNPSRPGIRRGSGSRTGAGGAGAATGWWRSSCASSASTGTHTRGLVRF